jgi:hypothetical protein
MSETCSTDTDYEKRLRFTVGIDDADSVIQDNEKYNRFWGTEKIPMVQYHRDYKKRH